MSLRTSRTSNPIFNNYFWDDGRNSSKKMTVFGIFVKSFFGILVIAAITGYIWKLSTQGWDTGWFTLGGMLGAAIISIIISFKTQWAGFLVPLYIIAKGFFLGGFSAYAHKHFPELPYQAIGVTIITFFVMLLLYQTRIIVVTKQVRSVIITATVSIMVVYIVSWILGFFGIRTFIWGTSWWAIGFNIFAAIVASFALLLDFDYIERYKNKAPKQKEWLATWGLLATLIWLYVEALRLLQKFAIKFR
ncbi:putative YccA/Bax inhibitor family protein [Winogradskyella wandonensis]|uniref:Putative YccA/Bax inhibitor family protein n=1 Tax=Winogradskyella wandonensis TaxID=1442586 RepID=A0A4R1KLD2_9FLAO|nr:Bax inhibitor-1/YccA family protein [Winogradskyella wandonensis]TCK65167.1 putative YccA/Bax inhibitor family protein [Winogradskyella wandonensis]